MGRGVSLTVEKNFKIIELMKEGKPLRNIAATTSRSVNSVKNVVTYFKENGKVEDSKKINNRK